MLSFDALGVPWQIEVKGELPHDASQRVTHLVDSFDRTWSRFRDDSLVAQAAKQATAVEFPVEGERLFALYPELYEATGGAVTPFVGDTLSALGYGPEIGDTPVLGHEPAVATTSAPLPWNSTARIEGSTVELLRPATIDVGAAGKGLLVDLIGDLLSELGASFSLVDGSGDLRVRGAAAQPVRIALEHPYDTTRAIGVAEIASGALCASAGNRRAWGDGLHHIIDGLTGLPTRAVVATWAIAPNAMLADGAATALFFLSPAELRQCLGVDGVRMMNDGTIERTAAFPGTVFA